MRKHIAPLMALSILLVAGFATAAHAVTEDPGRPDSPGKSADAPGQNKDDTSHQDPSNPDGTYRGKSPSTPDQDGTGMDRGIINNDKTGPGTDGNNGCGNDADREDDNNGWCGKPPAAESSSVGAAEQPAAQPAAGPSTQVLGESFHRAGGVAGLATTAADVVRFALAGGALLLVGLGIRQIGSAGRA